ncbi:probable 28S ribosomal protein S26, mitochondrial [Pseudomyrmex gracilis]|uniref:probable 28S ribosomal protein S26, mitochondrial n=1 Tax=Pseudomyrmex gracilis TaxID=219809 RepID=UPI0009949496|nr:probable 28S ribosomal protein S26, mitochondrial [Pseudomyrmex gracilis]
MQLFRIINNTLTTTTVGFYESFTPNSVYTQCVRWKRKPIWLPTANSKVFRVPKRPVIPVEEARELQSLNNNYRTYMRSFIEYLKTIEKNNAEVQFDEKTIREAEEEDFKICSAINDEWNAKLAKEREVRLETIKEKRKEKILQNILRHEEKEEKHRQKIDEKIRKAKEDSATFVTSENIDAAIEECLATVVNHNKALDMEGNWYEGKYPPPDPFLKEMQKSTAEQ